MQLVLSKFSPEIGATSKNILILSMKIGLERVKIVWKQDISDDESVIRFWKRDILAKKIRQNILDKWLFILRTRWKSTFIQSSNSLNVQSCVDHAEVSVRKTRPGTSRWQPVCSHTKANINMLVTMTMSSSLIFSPWFPVITVRYDDNNNRHCANFAPVIFFFGGGERNCFTFPHNYWSLEKSVEIFCHHIFLCVMYILLSNSGVKRGDLHRCRDFLSWFLLLLLLLLL